MDIQYYGANCVRLTTKKASVVIDDNLVDLGLKPVVRSGDIALFTATHALPKEAKLAIDQPGEYEVADTSVQGIAVRGYTDEAGEKNTTVFKIIGADVRVVTLGHAHPDLTDEQLEKIGAVDVLIVPVGNAGYTLDPASALRLIKKIEPKIIIPTHYADRAIRYPVPQAELAEVIKELAMEPAETLPKLKLKSGSIAEAAQLIILERQ